MKPEASFQTVSTEALLPFLLELLSEGKSVNMTVTGYSMMPLFRHGRDSVVLKLPEKLRKYDIVLYVQEDGKAILHRIVKCGKKGYMIVGDNQMELDGPIAPEQIKAVVTSFYHGGKEYSVTVWWYRLYSFIWGYCRLLRPLLLPFVRLGEKVIRKMR